MIDKWGDELLLDKKTEEATETEETADVPAELIGTWTDEASTETYAFNAEGSFGSLLLKALRTGKVL